jgi:hypothetical protein
LRKEYPRTFVIDAKSYRGIMDEDEEREMG